MKTFLLLFLPVLASWCSGPETLYDQQNIVADSMKNSITNEFSSTKNHAVIKKIKLLYKASGQYYHKVEFWDDKTQQLIKVIDLETINPYNKLPFKIIGKTYGAYKYSLKGENSHTIERLIGVLNISSGIEDKEPAGADGQIIVFNSPVNDDYIAIGFDLYITNSKNQVIAIKTAIFIYDSKGNLVNAIKDKQGSQAPVVSKDGKYVAVKYGGVFGECGGVLLSEGIDFYEVTSGKKIYTAELSNERWVYYFAIYDYFVSIEQSGGGENEKTIFTIYNIDQKLKYIKTFDRKTLGYPGVIVEKDYYSNGVYGHIYEQNGRHYNYGELRKRLSFEKDFQKINL